MSFFFLRHYFSVFYFQNDINKITINIETNKNLGEVYSCFDSDCDLMKFENNIYSYKLNQENPLFYKDISNVEVIFENEENTKEIKNISVFYGNKFNYFLNSSLIGKNVEFNNNTKYSINLPEITNSKSIIQKLGVYIESLFYNWYFYVISYILFAIYLIKTKKQLKFDTRFVLPLIIFLGAFLRFSHIDFIPLWNDELYTFTVISECGKSLNLKNIFIDPGNPPLFFLLSNIWLKFFNSSTFLIRLLPTLIGIFGIYLIYYVTDKIFNKKTALISAFLMAINIFIIVESNEIRSYILAMNLVLVGGFCFYKLLKEQSNKNLLLYFISLILLINTHFYCFLFVLFNFILGLILLKENKLKYFFINIIAFLTFGIYFLISYKASFSSTFNTWLSLPTLDVLYNHIVFYFGNSVFFIACILFLIFMYKKLNENERNLIIYSVSSVAFVFVVAYVFSWCVKPILFERYFCIFLPLFIVVVAILINYDYKTKFKPFVVLFIFLFSVCIPKYENFNLFSNIYFMVKYSTVDSVNYDDSYDVYFVIPDNYKYTNYFKNDFNKLKNPKIIISNNGIKENIDMINEYVKNSNKKRVIFYMPEICTNQIIKKQYNAQKIVTSILPVYKIFVVK